MVLAILFLVGVYFIAREAVTHSARNVSAARNHARQRATARGGRYDTRNVARRAARQATAGYWGRELRHGFPHVRAGLRTGWDEHQQALRRMQAEQARREHQHETEWRKLLAEIEEYLRQRREADGDPGEPKQPAPPPPHVMGPPDPQPAPPPPHVPSGEAEAETERAIRELRQKLQPEANGQQPPPVSTNGDHPVSGELNYDQLITLAEACQATAESAVNDTLLVMAQGAGDELGAMLPSDSTTLGLVADMSAAAKKVQEGGKELADAAAAVKDRVEKTYGPVVEAKEASGEALPEAAFAER